MLLTGETNNNISVSCFYGFSERDANLMFILSLLNTDIDATANQVQCCRVWGKEHQVSFRPSEKEAAEKIRIQCPNTK
jgi:hypothetical protein